jgi:NDP-sugar pyrophosphorylase family protein
MHVVIMAGGAGVRLRPYTSTLPKPLVPIGESYAILEIVLRQLAARGFTHVTLAINHLGSLIRAFVGDGSRFGLAVDYVEEQQPLSTIGPLFGIRERLPEHFLVMNGDVLTDLDYADVLASHERSGAPLTVATYRRSVKIDFGVLELAGDKLTAFSEKPVLHYQVSMGVYGLSRSTIAHYPVGQPFGFDQLVLDLLGRGEPPAGRSMSRTSAKPLFASS